MKRLLACILLLMLILFGCSGTKPAKPPVTEFSSSALLTIDGEQTECKLCSNLNEVILSISSGNMKGLTYHCSNENMKIEYGEISVSNSLSDFSSSAPYLLYSAIKSLRSPDSIEKQEQNENCVIYQGESVAGEFKAATESSTGLIKSIEFSNQGIIAEFSNPQEHK